MKDKLRDFIIAGSKSPMTIPCKDISEALYWRQSIHGHKRKQKIIADFQVRILDKNMQPVAFNRKDYQDKLMAKDFEPCYVVIQPTYIHLSDKLEKALEGITTQSEIEAKQEQEDAIESAKRADYIKQQNKNPFDLIREMKEKEEEEKENE